MDKYTSAYLNLIHQQVDDEMIRRAEQYNNKISMSLKQNISFDEQLKQKVYKWLNEYFTVGPYNGASMTFYLTQSDFLVIQDDYGLNDRKNGFKISLNREQWTYKIQWFVTHSFEEEFNKNNIQHAVDVIANWFNNIVSQQYQKYEYLSKGIVFNDDTKIQLKNWIISYINKERYTTNIFKFDSYRCLGIYQYSNGIINITFNIKTAYNDWFPFYRFTQFTINDVDKAVEEISQWITSRQL